MAFLAIENASSSSSIPSSTPGCKYEYEVFLSFRGTDTRNNFTDHLYTALDEKGIITFRDNEKLERGTLIAPKLLRAIEESKYAVVILSKDYASSSWCLAELTKIIECMEEKQLIVLPVFHYVDPSDVRNQRETFDKAFEQHEKNCKHNIEDVLMWKAAFKKVSNLAGWHLNEEKPESEVIKEIIQKISSKMYHKFSSVSERLVGMDSREEEMLDLCFGEGLDCVRFVGICGMGGIGKTTLAQKIYKRICCDFDASSFISNVRENSKSHGLVYLQKQLLSEILVGTEKHIWNDFEGINVLGERLHTKKVLIVLDDVDQDKQLEALAGNHDWFGVGSRIIVTSRDCHLLRRNGVKDIYIAKELNGDEALELFSWKAFKKPHPKEIYVDLSINFVSYADGLPLALKVLGSSLFGKTLNAWRSARDKLEAKPNRDIMDVLELSVDGLDDTQKDLFLDIAFLFKDMDNYYIRDTLESLGHYAYDIDVLQDKSLITIDSNGALWMHDLLKEMGRDIVRRESPEEPGKRSRLLSYKDVLHVLKTNTGTEVVKDIMLNMPIEAKKRLSAEAFSKMKNLRFLKIGYVHPPQDCIGGPIQLPQGLSYLSNELRIIDWRGYPLKSLPTSFQPNKLVELRMRYSDIKQLWKGIMILNELKLIDLSDSQNLIEIPNLSGAPNLKQLILQRCTRLTSLPIAICNLMSLKTLNLSGCSKLDKLPENLGKIEGLEELDLSGTAIMGLPSSIIHLKNLKGLSLSSCGGLSSNKLTRFPLMQPRRSPDPMGTLERSLIGLCSLTLLDLSYCNVRTIPNALGCLSSLSSLNLMGNNFVYLPESFIQLSNLNFLGLSGCTHLRMLPKLPLNIEYIYAIKCTSLETLLLRPEYDFRPVFNLLNWDKLIKNQRYGDLVSTMLGRYIINSQVMFQGQKDVYDLRRNYFLTISGSEIPKWFSRQNVGGSVNLQVPSDLLGNKLMGIAVCAVFVFRKHHPLHQLNIQDYGDNISTHTLSCSVSGTWLVPGIRLQEELNKIESYQLYLLYFSSAYFAADYIERLTEVDANGSCQIKVKFEPRGPGLEVAKCGARLVLSERDIEDLMNQTKAGPSSCITTPYDEDGFEDSEKDTKIKQSRDDSDGEGAGPSGEATSNDVDEPQPYKLPHTGYEEVFNWTLLKRRNCHVAG